MKLSNSFVTAGFAALALAGATVLGTADSAQALGIYFSPAATNIDDDTINDIVANVDDFLLFDVILEVAGTSAPGISSASYTMKWDISELKLMTSSYSEPLDGSSVTGSPGLRNITQSGLDIPSLPIWNLSTPSTYIATLGQFKFKVLNGLTNDGISDFSLKLNSVIGGGNSFVSSSEQMIEVQGAKAVPTPALLPGLVAFGMSLVRKRKQEQAA
jgi:hypothetical protein